MREKAKIQTSIYFTEGMHEKIKDAAKRFDVPVSEIVRECVRNDLPKLIDRETKKRRARQKRV